MPESKEEKIIPASDSFKIRRVGEDEKLPFTAHLAELRYRLLASVISVLVCFAVCYFFIDTFIHVLETPIKSAIPDLKLTFLAPTEAFFVSMKVAFFAGIAFAWPAILYQAWMFIAPGLHKKERRFAFPLVTVGTLLLVMGISFTYYIVLPVGLKFLIGFGQNYWTANIAVDYYLTFCVKLSLAFGLIFQLPLVIAILGKMELVTSQQLKNFRSYSIVVAFIIAAILTPPDAISQCMMAVPLVILYEVSIYVVMLIEKKKGAEEPLDGTEKAAESK